MRQIAHTGAHITALQLLAIAGYSASLCLVLCTPVRTLWPIQLRNLGLTPQYSKQLPKQFTSLAGKFAKLLQ